MMVQVFLIRAGVLKEGTEREWDDFATSLVIEKYLPVMEIALRKTKALAPAGNGKKTRGKKAILG